jgi:cell division septation protein DedD
VPAAPPDPLPGAVYRVQIGAYARKENAENVLRLVKDAGFKDAFIKQG